MTNNKCVKVFTFGWSPEFVIRPLIEEGVSKDDIILVIAARPENEYVKKRVKEAYNQVLSFLRIAGAVNTFYREVDLGRDFLSICRDVASIIKEHSSSSCRLTFYLTGGMRVLIIATLVVARLFSALGREVEIRVSREDRPVVFVVPVELINLDPRDFTEAQLEILRQLSAYEEVVFEDLAIRRSEVTVRKHLTKLRGKGVVRRKVRGRRQFYKLSELGELLLSLMV